MEKLVETIAKYLVDDPDEVTVQNLGEDDRHEDVIRLSVASDDMGKVIGKQGRIAKALRTVIKAAAVRERRQVNVEIVSNEEIAEAANAVDESEANDAENVEIEGTPEVVEESEVSEAAEGAADVDEEE